MGPVRSGISPVRVGSRDLFIVGGWVLVVVVKFDSWEVGNMLGWESLSFQFLKAV